MCPSATSARTATRRADGAATGPPRPRGGRSARDAAAVTRRPRSRRRARSRRGGEEPKPRRSEPAARRAEEPAAGESSREPGRRPSAEARRPRRRRQLGVHADERVGRRRGPLAATLSTARGRSAPAFSTPMDYAIIKLGNKQHRVRDGETLVVDRLRDRGGQDLRAGRAARRRRRSPRRCSRTSAARRS